MTDADAKQQVHPRPHQRSGSTSEISSQQTRRYAVAGLSASLVGLGLARFSYTPLIPALIAAKWFGASDVVYLGAANLAGYLAGALAARTVAARIGAVRTLRAMMLLATLSFFCQLNPGVVHLVLRLALPVGAHRRNHHGAGGLRHSAAYH